MSYLKLNACKKYKTANRTYLMWLKGDGWTIDRWGHAKRFNEFRETMVRKKFMRRKIRVEVKGNDSWVHVGDERYNDWMGEMI